MAVFVFPSVVKFFYYPASALTPLAPLRFDLRYFVT